MSGLQIPHIVAGENLDLPILGPFLKSCGAFFIKREWGGNGLYKTIMEEYITTLLLEGSMYYAQLMFPISSCLLVYASEFGMLYWRNTISSWQVAVTQIGNCQDCIGCYHFGTRLWLFHCSYVLGLWQDHWNFKVSYLAYMMDPLLTSHFSFSLAMRTSFWVIQRKKKAYGMFHSLTRRRAQLSYSYI